MKKYFYIFCFFLILGCTKDKGTLAPTIYIFKVVDDFTNTPIINCSVILERYHYPASSQYDTIGYTNNNGNFTYTFDKVLTHQSQAYEYYFMRFSKENYFDGKLGLEQTHTTTNQIIKLNKKTTLGLKIRRTTPPIGCPPEWYILYFNFSTVSPCLDCFVEPDTASVTTYYYHYEKVPSNKVTRVSWMTHFWSSCTGNIDIPWQNQDVMTGYNDTTFFNIDY